MGTHGQARLAERELHISILGVHFRITGLEGRQQELAQSNFSAYFAAPQDVPSYCHVSRSANGQIRLESGGGDTIWESNGNDDDYNFLYTLEKDITLHLQRARNDLLFVHAAVLEHAGRRLIIAADSGTGKSTLAYALQSRDFIYVSDELAPIDTNSCRVHDYRHALCLKSPPPAPFAKLPAHFRTERTLHIPAEQLNTAKGTEPQPIAAVIFLQRDGHSTRPAIKAIGKAEATTRLYSHALNALAHPGAGLDATAAVLATAPAYTLQSADLNLTCQLLEQLVI